ncbi:hypothetical protein OPV22_033986 [Ensete ventricosum]|uniref:Uncharacterized protein n=1 Tax=Ensete ventricosum TaxID=4639 RepID=A0AAV8PTB8_ENSVE|nr:hypothetical protein OPV22_033986 [Ensete ventricosum]
MLCVLFTLFGHYPSHLTNLGTFLQSFAEKNKFVLFRGKRRWLLSNSLCLPNIPVSRCCPVTARNLEAGLVHGRYICSQLSDGQDRIVQGDQLKKRRNIIENSISFLIFLPAIKVCSTSRTWRKVCPF